jgi:uncharacterized protein YjeT (DUF2065 family)
MERVRRAQGLPIGWTILLLASALLLFVVSGISIRSIPSFTSRDAADLLLADFTLPCLSLWIAYWAIFHFSAYLRPRTLWREFGLVALSLGFVTLSWWIRVIVSASRFGI